ncbi:MAG TPA: hypothetical protein VLH56_16140 [Dissulfurispiraceae bacterium]|nr:hypothetical protein [Dissulfurispiraceae bacterium]
MTNSTDNPQDESPLAMAFKKAQADKEAPKEDSSEEFPYIEASVILRVNPIAAQDLVKYVTVYLQDAIKKNPYLKINSIEVDEI